MPLPLPSRGVAEPVVVHVTPDDLAAQLRADVVAGLGEHPRTLPPKWFYDARGSELFEEITRLPEYYPTRREREVLETRAAEVADLSRADTLVELGAGSAEKTRLLLDALRATGNLVRFVPVDVSVTALVAAGDAVAAEYPEVEVLPVAADFERHLHLLPGSARGRRLVAFLGGTIGNLLPDERVAFLTELATSFAPGDALLLGADLVKDPARLVAAYDDAQGVTAAFNRNVLTVLRRELGAELDTDAFTHVARWDPDEQRIEMRLRAEGVQRVRIARLGLDVELADGEEIRTEVSAKFTDHRLDAELGAAGLTTRCRWTDDAGDYSVTLAVPADSVAQAAGVAERQTRRT